MKKLAANYLAFTQLASIKLWREFNEFTAFCNGPGEVKSPSDCHAAELTLLSVASADHRSRWRCQFHEPRQQSPSTSSRNGLPQCPLHW
jgi:hypothetical protein